MIAVVGLGFVGLTTALGLADVTGRTVYGYDANIGLRKMLAEGTIPFYEEGLEQMLERHLHKRFRLAECLEDAVEGADVILVCVGTPSLPGGEVSLDDLLGALSQLSAALTNHGRKVIAVKSTVPPRTMADKVIPLLRSGGWEPGRDIGLVHNPEFLREGCALKDFIEPDRIVVGAVDDWSFSVMRELYAPFEAPLHEVGFETAEFTKYLSNSLLASLISFANEMAMAAGAIGGIDVRRSFDILHEDKRWRGAPAGMAKYVYPGCGFGGYCLPKDTAAAIAAIEAHGYTPTLLQEVVRVNERAKLKIVNDIAAAAAPDQVLGILGLSFKPGSDDVRGCVAADILSALAERGYRHMLAFDPMANRAFASRYPKLPLDYADRLEEVIAGADTIVVLTAWPIFTRLKADYPDKQWIDGRYCLI
ncbi:UDPglucose 6-dehydrogenase [Paenibacillus phyllosphaerae]|uniref:UDP-glucose 6-dehydrogenase n=1 Tax=Paenibacillus phyllosphaerae TaxID=274593 RepID=A0A7W5AT38_9BACL|nr:nucleotide sugar dehydrogenase [Paenibacillus phyllosphaerae]MBB3108122.1 UDPglucose 6-dehydrogenase [Paenibacillus phyllosphaerae]